MNHIAFPYQCLVASSKVSPESEGWTLYGASGPRLVVQSSDGTSSVWPEQTKISKGLQQDDEFQGPPGKRIKLEVPKEQASKFSSLVLSNNKHYLVGVTGEDKCVRVFQIDSQNQLQQLSERCMSRRPSSITLTSDDLTILCADKFGDVYALPLLPQLEDEQSEIPIAAATASEQPEGKDWLPSATALTVHSGRNRKTLEEQLKQKAKGPIKSKEHMKFKHELLLGHVSMLTDIVHAKMDSRNYIITSDRDEHVRISRGQPQAHIIEGFCFGHESFVSRLCLTQSGLLISGGGDDQLLVWDWLNYRLVERLPIRDVMLNHLQSYPDLRAVAEDSSTFKIAVSGIWSIPSDKNRASEIFATCESIPALFHFQVGAATSKTNVIPLNGNALAVAFIQPSHSSYSAIVSIDNIHKPGSTTQLREDDDVSGLQCFYRQEDGSWQEDGRTFQSLGWFDRQRQSSRIERSSSGSASESKVRNGTGPPSTDDKAVRDILYNVENLRKRPGAED